MPIVPVDIDIGQLRKRVTLQRRSTEQDSSGEQIEVWSNLGIVWGEIRSLNAVERGVANAVHAEDTHEVTLRYFPGLLAKDRIVYTDNLFVEHLYNLTGIDDVQERHRMMKCTAVEGLSPG